MMNDTQKEAMATYKTGIVTEVKKGFIRANIPEFEDFVTDWLPVLIFGDTQNNKSFAMPSVGAQVALLLDGYGEDGVCLGTIYSEVDEPTAPSTAATHTTYSDGAVVEYDPTSSSLKATGWKNATLDGGTLDIKAKQTTFDSPVTINGALIYTAGMQGSGGAESGGSVIQGGMQVKNGDIEVINGDVVADGVSAKEHPHGGVLVGGGESGKPIPS